MRKLIVLALFALLLSIVLIGCAPEKEISGPAEEETEITADIAGVDELDSELDMSELESLDQEFADLEELFS